MKRMNDQLQVSVRVRDGKKVTHEGIKVEFVGNIGASMIISRVPCVLRPDA
jgi:Vacuolar protein sorting-associated protein 26